MNRYPSNFVKIIMLLVCGIFTLHAQITITNDSQSYASLTSQTVTMTGWAELRVTNATTPLTSCTINLNSNDAFLFLTKVKPSVVSSTYLSQIKVNGAAAVVNTNCRIAQYGDGAVVIPHASSFSPMTVYTGPYFTGSSTTLTQYTAHSDSTLGTTFANQISSFKLKRGYMCTIAQNSSGTGVSKNYVAQDGDIEVAVLPADLNDSVSFIRVFPWRWSNKKGIGGNIESGLNLGWKYNWNLDQNSTMDLEYVPIRQLRYWPSLAQDWQARGSTHLSGYNEPDQTGQANMLVGDAIYSWPDLLGTGLRLGSPAPSDGGLSWLYSFMTQANSNSLRVDYVAVHYYRSYSSASDPAGATTQFYNFLKGVHDTVKKPIWVTEFNNGANWTTGPDPTAAQQAATVSAMMDMLESTPWIERYALYNWVEDVRRVKWDDGSLTSAGVVYRDKQSNISYQQEIPGVPTAAGALYKFENNTADSWANGHPCMLQGQAKYATGYTGQAVTMSGANEDHVLLSPTIGDSTDFTFGAWVYWNGSSQWQRIFDLGDGSGSYMFLTPRSGSDTMRFEIFKTGTAAQQLNTTQLPANTWTHVAVTISGNTGKLFVNGVLVDTNTSMTLNPSDLATKTNYLGESQFDADPLFAGKLDTVQFLPFALADAKVATMAANSAPVFTSTSISGGTATQNVAYTGSIAGTATDANVGDTITYSKVSGPAWLTVAANGALSGTPTNNDELAQQFIVYATDSYGATALATLTITLPTIQGNGVWTVDASGTWGTVTNWTSNFPANGSGYTADFSTLNITADRIATLDSSRTITGLKFGDTSGTQSWTLDEVNGKELTLAGTPTIVVNQNSATIIASLTGTAGFTKSGAGTLILKGDNTLSGTLNIDTNSGANDGVVRLAGLNSATSISAIAIRNNNAGYSTLELDGTLGSVSCPGSIALSGRGNTTVAIRNLAGDNTLSGAMTINSGGGNYYFQSDAGSLIFGSGITSAATGSRTLTFQGAGNFSVNGVISNGSATTGVSIVKNGAGTLTLGGLNTHTGTMAINGGVVTLTGTGTRTEAAISMVSGTSLNINRNIALAGAVTGTGTITNTGSDTITGDFSTFTGSYSHNTIYASTAFNTATATSKTCTYNLLSTQGSLQGFIAGAAGDQTLEMGGLNGVAGSLFRGGFSVSGTTTLSVGNLNGTDTFAGDITNGTTKILAFTKVGSGTMTLAGANTYTGATYVNGGKLFINGSSANSIFTVANGGTLGGTGSIAGNITVQPGGKIAPGNNNIGTLTASGNLTLLTGSVTLIELNKSTSTNDTLAVAGTLTYAGTLNVSNLGGTLAAGDSFTIFTGGTRTGTFSSMILPTLASGLSWDTSSINQGIIRIIYTNSIYTNWAATFSFPSGTSSPLLDTDNDGTLNVLEWILGANPLSSDLAFLPIPLIQNVSTTNYPAADPAKKYLTMTANIRKNHTGWIIIPQANSSLLLLDDAASSSNIFSFQAADLGEFETRTWLYTIPVENAPRGFMRLKVVAE